MKQKKISLNIPARQWINYGICLAALVAFVMIAIYPDFKKLTAYNSKIHELQLKIEKQKFFFPVYNTLTERLKELEHHKNTFLPKIPFRAVYIKEADIANVMSEIKQKILAKNFEVRRINPDVNSVDDEKNKSVKIEIAVKGDFIDFNSLLLQLNYLGYVDGIERIKIQNALSFEEFYLTIRIRMLF